MGLELVVKQINVTPDVERIVSGITKKDADVIMITPANPVWRAIKPYIYPVSIAQKIPIMGVNRADIARGAFACYAGPRFACGAQAARLVRKVLDGVPPSQIPLETPKKLELVINRATVEKLGLKIPDSGWAMATTIAKEPVD